MGLYLRHVPGGSGTAARFRYGRANRHHTLLEELNAHVFLTI
jgi:hypothetical protein